MEYHSMKPYPEVRVTAPNIEYGKILSQNYAGCISEDSAIHLYLYQSLITKEMDEEFSKIMEHISEVEMHHFSILGQLITLLGVDPQYRAYDYFDTATYWNSAYVSYDKQMKKILETNIRAEQQAIDDYEYCLEVIDDAYVQENIKRILEDEKIHLQIFEKFYKEYQKKDRSLFNE